MQLFEGTYLGHYQFIIRRGRRKEEETSPVLEGGGFERTTSEVFVPKLFALPLCSNRCKVNLKLVDWKVWQLSL